MESHRQKKDGPAETAFSEPAVGRNTRTADNLLPQWPTPNSVPNLPAQLQLNAT